MPRDVVPSAFYTKYALSSYGSSELLYPANISTKDSTKCIKYSTGYDVLNVHQARGISDQALAWSQTFSSALPPPQLHPKKKPTAAADISLGAETLVFYKRGRVLGNYEASDLRNQGVILYQNVQDLLARFFISIHYNEGPVSNWRDWCIGVSSKTRKNNLEQLGALPLPMSEHLPMFDFDGKNIKSLLRKEVRLLQQTWKLGPATLFRTKRGFHVYFMTDVVSWDAYRKMLGTVDCCKGFKRCALANGYGVLRVSAKYSTFDIKMDSIILPETPKPLPARKIRKAHVIEALIALGEKSGTHFASLYPGWAHYREDETPWKPPTKNMRTVGKTNEIEHDLPVEIPIPPGRAVAGQKHNSMLSNNMYYEPLAHHSITPKLLLKKTKTATIEQAQAPAPENIASHEEIQEIIQKINQKILAREDARANAHTSGERGGPLLSNGAVHFQELSDKRHIDDI
jgi:hypothetical protein